MLHNITHYAAFHRGLFLMDRYALDDVGSGSHVHVSLYQNGDNVFKASDGTSRYGISTVGEEFMAGVLHHLPEILAFTAPVPNRYLLFHMILCSSI
jgi:glutamine synthetase